MVKNGKMTILGGFSKQILEPNFRKLKTLFSIDIEWSTLAKRKVAISKTVPTAASLRAVPQVEKNNFHPKFFLFCFLLYNPLILAIRGWPMTIFGTLPPSPPVGGQKGGKNVKFQGFLNFLISRAQTVNIPYFFFWLILCQNFIFYT